MSAEPIVVAWPFISADLDGAAKATGVSRSSIERAIARKELVAHYRGRTPLLRADELYAWVASLPTERPER